MKAVQIDRYARAANASVRDVPMPETGEDEVLIKVKAAAVNPLEQLIMTGSVRLIQDYPMPLTLGNECSGVVAKVGRLVKRFKVGDAVYTRLPLRSIGALAEYVAVEQSAVARMPAGYEFATAAAIPLTGLTAWQGLTEILQARPGETVFIPGGSGSFGQMAVPIARALGLNVIVSGNARAGLDDCGRRDSISGLPQGKLLGAANQCGLCYRRARSRRIRAGAVRVEARRAAFEPAHRA